MGFIYNIMQLNIKKLIILTVVGMSKEEETEGGGQRTL